MPQSHHKKPWPLKWVAVAIVAVIIPYTYLTLHYRKPGPAFQPYEDLKSRATTSRLVSAGYQRIALPTRRPAEANRGVSVTHAAVMPAAAGLPAALKSSLIDLPALPVSVDSVVAGSSIAQTDPYVIEFTCTLTDNRQQPTGANLYRKDNQVVIVPTFEKLDSGLLARSRQHTVAFEVPAGSLKAGTYSVTVIGSGGSRGWTLQVH